MCSDHLDVACAESCDGSGGEYLTVVKVGFEDWRPDPESHWVLSDIPVSLPLKETRAAHPHDLRSDKIEAMPWCCADFERHLGRFDDDGLRVDYALKFPPGRKIFWSRRQDSAECVSAISTCPWCGADLSPFPTPDYPLWAPPK